MKKSIEARVKKFLETKRTTKAGKRVSSLDLAKEHFPEQSLEVQTAFLRIKRLVEQSKRLEHKYGPFQL